MVRLTKVFGIAAVAALALVVAPGGWAQTTEDMTAEEITNKFKKQKTRGLVIVPSGGQAEEAETASVTPAATEEYTAVDREDQVNVRISFDFDSASLRTDQKQKLSTLCQAMKAVDVSVFQIIGHTDSSGSANYNERLSLLRAQEVKRFLVGDCGIADTRLKAIGMGESAPFDPSNPRADENRRVEFQALG